MSLKSNFILPIIILLILSACSAREVPPIQSVETPDIATLPINDPTQAASLAPTSTPANTPTTISTTPISTERPSPTASGSALLLKWRLPIYAAALSSGICSSALNMAEAEARDSLAESGVSGQLFVWLILIGATHKVVSEIDPVIDQQSLWFSLQTNVETLASVIAAWLNAEISESIVIEILDCSPMHSNLQDILEVARSEGLTESELALIFEDVVISLQEDNGETTDP